MKKIFISAGEASGDAHGANLIQNALVKNSALRFYGMGGVQMQAAGCELLVDCKKLSIMGFFQIAKQFRSIYTAMRLMRKGLKTHTPALLILIDYSGFNLRLAKYAKNLGIKILYYISPHVWAWRRGRIKLIRKYVDHMAVIFPFEVDFYRRENIPVTYVGNFLVQKTKPKMTAEEAYTLFQLDKKNLIIGLVPGSRHSEIKQIFPTIIQSAELLAKEHPNVQFVLPLASSLSMNDLQSYLKNTKLKINIISNHLYDVVSLCTAVIAVSGTVTLEIALLGVPMLIIYKIAPITFTLLKHIVKTEHIGLCNLAGGERIVKEYIQDDANVNNIAQEINQIIFDQNYRANIRAKLASLKNKLINEAGSTDIAEVVLQLI